MSDAEFQAKLLARVDRLIAVLEAHTNAVHALTESNVALLSACLAADDEDATPTKGKFTPAPELGEGMVIIDD